MEIKNSIIAIDPDVEKSGVAILDKEERTLETRSCSFCDLVFDLLPAVSSGSVVVIEGGWLNEKSSFHAYANARTASYIGKSVGRNHEVGRKIVEVCDHYGLKHHVVKPLLKSWKGRDRKITQQELSALCCNYRVKNSTKRMNQDQRDAGLLALMYINLK